MKFFKIQSEETTANEKILLINKKIEEIYKSPLQDGSLYYKIDIFSRKLTRKYSVAVENNSPNNFKLKRSATNNYNYKGMEVITKMKLSKIRSLGNNLDSSPKSSLIIKEISIN